MQIKNRQQVLAIAGKNQGIHAATMPRQCADDSAALRRMQFDLTIASDCDQL